MERQRQRSDAKAGEDHAACLRADGPPAAGRARGVLSLEPAVCLDNPSARALYLGFAPSGDEDYLMPGGAALAALGEQG